MMDLVGVLRAFSVILDIGEFAAYMWGKITLGVLAIAILLSVFGYVPWPIPVLLGILTYVALYVTVATRGPTGRA